MKALYLKYIILIIAISSSLLGCSKETFPKEELPKSEHTAESEITESDTNLFQSSEITEVTESSKETEESQILKADFDIDAKLSEAEETASVLEKKLLEDANLKQIEMNEISHEIYIIWDTLLNEIWSVLKDTLDEKTMNTLLAEQREWISMKETEVKKAGEPYAGGSMATLICNTTASKLTKTRVYELAVYLK